MSLHKNYKVLKRGAELGPYSPNEIIDLLRMRELSNMCKVKVEDDWIEISGFINLHEKGELSAEESASKIEEVEPVERISQKPKKTTKTIPSSPTKPLPKPVKIHEPELNEDILVDRDGVQFGPYHLCELKEYLKMGRISLRDTCWYEGISDWVPVSQIPSISAEISSLGAAPPPPPKPPPLVGTVLDSNDENKIDGDRSNLSTPSDEYMKMLGLNPVSHDQGTEAYKAESNPNEEPQKSPVLLLTWSNVLLVCVILFSMNKSSLVRAQGGSDFNYHTFFALMGILILGGKIISGWISRLMK